MNMLIGLSNVVFQEHEGNIEYKVLCYLLLLEIMMCLYRTQSIIQFFCLKSVCA